MAIPPPTFGQDDVKIEAQELVFKRFFSIEKLTLRHKLFAGGWSEPITRELFRRGGAVAVLLFDPKLRQVGLVEQFRVGAMTQPDGPWLLEIVAGMFDADETAEVVARREVAEETGLEFHSLHFICEYFSSPGGTDEKLSVYCALCDLSNAGGIHGVVEEGEDIRVQVLPVDDVFRHLYSGRFNNAATLIGLQWLQFNIDRLVCTEQR
ncbi:MAG: NUDIX domain-containing protein [Cellvibrio sp.]